MKKLILISTFLLIAGFAFGQALQKGNLIGVHVMTVELKTGVTMDQFIDFFNEKMKPAWEKAIPGIKIFGMKGIRGEHENEFGVLVQYKDEAARDKSYNADGTPSEYGIKVNELLIPVNTEAEKLGTWTSVYTDWVLQ